MKKGFTLVEIMIVVGIIALLAAIAIPGLLRSRVNSAEANAQATLKTLATACESFASANNGNYPAAVANLLGGNAPYLNEDYADGAIRQGYVYTVGGDGMDITIYHFTGIPQGAIANGGARSYEIKTGALLNEIVAVP